MTSSLYFLRTIYAVGAIQLAAIFLAWYGQSGLMVADSIALFLADWTAFTLMAHRHARLGPLNPSRLSQILGIICLALGVTRLFTVQSADSVGIILGSYLCLGGTYLLFTRLRDIPSCWPEMLVAGIVLLRVGFIAGTLDAWLRVTPWTVEIGSWFLYLLGHETLVMGKTVATPMGAVILEWPCTGLMTGGGLVAIATALAFSKPWTKAAKAFIFASGVALAFLAGCMRVVVMSYVVSDIPKFQFWHGTEGFLIFAAVTYSLFALSIFLAPRLFPPLPTILGSDPGSDPRSVPTSVPGSDPKIRKVMAMGMIGLAVIAWIRLPLVVGKHGDFPYPDLAPALQASAPELTRNSDPYAESSWGRVARYRILQGELSLSFRPSGDFTAIRTIFRNLADNTPTEWETVSVPEGSVTWRLQEGKLELATLIHPNGKLTTSEEEFGQAIQKVRLDPANLAKWFIGKAKLRERRAVLVHLQVAGVGADQVQSFVPVVVQAARLTASQF
jgi:exosortase/archaeosortase family protein